MKATLRDAINLRSFIAIELPDTVKSALAGLQDDLKKEGADVRWVKPDNIHLTLKFLGDMDEGLVVDAVEKLKGTCSTFPAFNLEICGTGVFPNMKSPRVIWVGIMQSPLLADLQSSIEDGMSALRFTREKRTFTPHLTLGRFRSAKGKDALLEKIGLYKDSGYGMIDARAVSFMRSDLSPSGAKHTAIAEIQFSGTSA